MGFSASPLVRFLWLNWLNTERIENTPEQDNVNFNAVRAGMPNNCCTRPAEPAIFSTQTDPQPYLSRCTLNSMSPASKDGPCFANTLPPRS
jgi:hypothetical protein